MSPSASSLSALALFLCSTVSAQVTERISVSSTGAEGDGQTFQFVSPSTDGRFIAFCSTATNLIPGGTTSTGHVYVRDRQTGTTEIVSISSTGVQGNNGSYNPSISADGRYVAFESLATNLDPLTQFSGNVFVRDRASGTTQMVDLTPAGVQGNGGAQNPSISADGRYLAFVCTASNLVPGDTNGFRDVFVRDLLTGATERVNVGSGGVEANGDSADSGVRISADGRLVGFSSTATNLVPGDANGWMDAFVHDRLTGITERISVDSSGAEANQKSGYYGVFVSGDGRFAAFTSFASNLVVGDTNGYIDIFVRDRLNGTTERVNLAQSGAQANGPSGTFGMSISDDGRFVTYDSSAYNLVPGTNGPWDVYLRDRLTGTTELVSVDSNGSPVWGHSNLSTISGDGRFVVFQSSSGTLVPNDNNGVADDFVHDRHSSGSTSFCDAGIGGVIACPCANAPSGPGRGCNNSSATGGAALTASGVAYVSIDSLVFTTSGEKPTATSILMQGTLLAANGLVFGQGVRCVGGTLKRLYTKVAVTGSITAPNFGAGDPTVTARSAALGDVIASGQSRFYLVYYRDPVVLGGCPATSSYNATQTSRVIWGL